MPTLLTVNVPEATFSVHLSHVPDRYVDTEKSQKLLQTLRPFSAKKRFLKILLATECNVDTYTKNALNALSSTCLPKPTENLFKLQERI